LGKWAMLGSFNTRKENEEKESQQKRGAKKRKEKGRRECKHYWQGQIRKDVLFLHHPMDAETHDIPPTLASNTLHSQQHLPPYEVASILLVFHGSLFEGVLLLVLNFDQYEA